MRYKNENRLLFGWGCFAVLVNVVVWAAIIFVAIHFLSKVW
jgi:hypothetical protein